MRSVFSFVTTLAAITVGTTALEASVITFGSETQKQGLKSPDISSATLRQLLELRSGSPTTSSLGSSDEENIEFLNKLAGSPARLFGAPAADAADGGLDTLLVVLEGLTGDIGRSIQDEYRNELLTTAFATGSAKDTFLDYILEARAEGIVNQESKHCSSSSDINESCFQGFGLPENFDLTLGNGVLSQVTMGESWINYRKGLVVVRIAFKSRGILGHINDLKSFLSNLRSLSLNGRRVTAVVLPDPNATQKMPRSRRAPEHTALDTTINWGMNERFMTADQQAQASLSLAPVCYASNSSCNDATNTCSGHGVCYEKSGGCYACLCHDTYVQTASGAERKIQWGGSACQKRDISSPFFLIMGVTITILLVVTSAIAMIFGLGNDELPGVISFGVGSARAQK
ncbi:hypothetical protein BDW68DRAFT_171807 [Aspergillus falconensis]